MLIIVGPAEQRKRTVMLSALTGLANLWARYRAWKGLTDEADGERMTEWPSKRGPITKIMPSDGCKGDTAPLALGLWYDFQEFGWHLGNVGYIGPSHRQRPQRPV